MKMNRVLIVDDNEDNLYLLRALLQGHGYEVVTATQGADALDKARQNPPDLIIADILMPVMDGFALCREWKKDGRLKSIPFIFYTATYTDERDRKFALSLGAERFITKPEEPDAFMAIIRDAIQQVESQPAALTKPAAEAPARLPIEALEEEAVCLKQYNEALIRRVEVKMEQLEQAKRELEQKLDERNRADAELRQATSLLRNTFEAITDLVTVHDRDLRVVFSNWHGRDYVAEEERRSTPHCYACYMRRDKPCESCPTLEVFGTGCPAVREVANPYTGKVFEVSAYPVFDNSGAVELVVEHVHDITERKRTELELGRLNRALRTISCCNQVLVRAESEQELLESVCKKLVEVGGYRMAWVGYAEHDEAKTVRPVAHAGFEDGYLASARVAWADDARGRGPTGRAIRSGLPAINRDTQTDASLSPWREEALKRGYASSIALPLQVRSQIVGALTLHAAEPDAFDDEEGKLLAELADDLSFGIDALRSREERQRAEEELLFKTALLEAQAEATIDGILVVDEAGRVLLANRRFSEMWNIPEDVISTKNDAAVLKSVLAQLKDPGAFLEKVKYLYSQETEKLRDEIEFKDGRVFDRYSSPLQGSTGKNYGRIWYFRDITERKRAENALRESEERFRELAELLPEIVYEMDERGIVTFANRQAFETTGYSEEDFRRGFEAAKIYAPSDQERARQSIREVMSGKRSGLPEFTAQRKDGSLFPVIALGAPIIRQGKPAGIRGILVDITERRQSEDRLHETSEVLRTLFQASPLPIVALDRNMHVRTWNPAAERLFGWTEAEVLGQPLPIIPESRREEFRAELDGLSRGEKSAPFETQRLRKDGSLVEVSISTGVLRDASGEITGFMGIVMDISEHKSLEGQLRRAQKMEAIGQLAGGVAHDFNNLLTIISGYGQMLQGRLKSKELGYLEEILKASDRAGALTSQLLAFSRRQILAPQVLDLNSAVINMEEMLRRLIGEDVELVIFPHPHLGRVKADPGQIEQVIMNLAVNARDAMPRGGKLTIETADVDLDETFAKTHTGAIAGPHVMLAVSDTGIGMDSTVLAHVFEPFFTTKEVGKGTGLGLATVYGIVKQSGGSVWVYSEPGRGTTMKIYLPRIEEWLPEARPTETPSEPARGSETVLVVEDEDGVRSLVCETLESQGYKVLEAKGSKAALLMLEQHAEPIHLLLTDVVMPQMSGVDLAKRMRAVRPEAKVLYMSGYMDRAVVQHGILEHGTPFLQKPFVPSALARKVREILDAKP